MGTMKKIALAALVSTMMVLAFGVGLLPSSHLPGAIASENGRKDMVGLLDMILGVDKVLNSVTITFPREGSTVKVQQGSASAMLTVQATIDPRGSDTDVTFGLDGEDDSTLNLWTGDETSSARDSFDVFAGALDLATLGTSSIGITAHFIYALGLENLAKVSVAYDVLDFINFNLEIIAGLTNPFTELEPGEIYIKTIPGVSGDVTLVIAKLDTGPAKGAGTTLGVPIETGNGQVITVVTPNLQRFIAEGVIQPGEDGLLFVKVANSIVDLVDVGAAGVGPLPNTRAFGSSFVAIDILYTVPTRGAPVFTSVGTLPLTLPVTLSFNGLDIPTPYAGAGIWGHNGDSDLDGVFTASPINAVWAKRVYSGIDVSMGGLSIPLQELSIFAALNTTFQIYNVTPNVGLSGVATPLRISGFFRGIVPINEIYKVYFGDLINANLATIVAIDAAYNFIDVLVPPTVVASNTTVNVTVLDMMAVSDFVTLKDGYTYVVAPSISGISPTTGPFTPISPDDDVTITGANLSPTIEVLFGANAATIVARKGNTLVVLPPAVANPGNPVTVGVSVTTVGGTADSPQDYTYDDLGIRINTVTPDNAWLFGGVVVHLAGTGFTTTGTGVPVVLFGGVEGTVLTSVTTDTDLFVIAPAQDVDTFKSLSAMRNVELSVSTDPAKAIQIFDGGFDYVRWQSFGGLTTTATILTGGVGTRDIYLDVDFKGIVHEIAQLTIPGTAGSDDLFLLARSTLDPLDFDLEPETANTGDNVDGAWSFDLHLYEAAGLAGKGVSGGDSALTEISSSSVFDPKNPATLTFDMQPNNLLDTDISGGDTHIFGLSTTLDYAHPSATPDFGSSGAQTYHSTVLLAQASITGTKGTSHVSSLDGVGIIGLGAIAVRVGSVIPHDDLNVRVDPSGNASAQADGVDTSTFCIISDGGGLAFVDGVTIGGVSATIIEPGGGDGTDDFKVCVTSPTSETAGRVDIVLSFSSPATPDFVIANGFNYIGGLAGFLPALLALLGLLLVGDNGGGGGGGPCFIATAAYGTPMAAEIDTLRALRDTYLLNNALGTAFVDVYYRLSPAIADVIAQSPALALLMRLLLAPVIFVSKMLLASPALSMALLFITGSVIGRRRSRKSKKTQG